MKRRLVIISLALVATLLLGVWGLQISTTSRGGELGNVDSAPSVDHNEKADDGNRASASNVLAGVFFLCCTTSANAGTGSRTRSAS